MTDSQQLLADYARSGSEMAFQELVGRYLDLVYSTALRLAGGKTHLAEDVAQTVFVDLARLAKGLSSEVRLGGWLHRHTCFVAAKTLRAERRRQARERQAVEMNAQSDHSEARLAEVAPILDDAINQLGAADRAAVLLRFYERLDFHTVGQALGTNEAAAQKRVARALEKLHGLLKRRGVALSIAGLTAALTVESVKAAPTGLAMSISGTAVATAAAETGNVLTFLRYMASTKLKTSIIGAVLLASVLTPLLVQRQAQGKVREQDQTWLQQSNQLAQLNAENQRLVALTAQTQSAHSASDHEFRELLRLRGEVGRLKGLVQKMSAKNAGPLTTQDQIELLKQMYAARIDRLKQWLEDHPSARVPEFQYLTDDDWLGAVETLSEDAVDYDYQRAARNVRSGAENFVLGKLQTALRAYAGDNSGQFPTSLSQLEPYLPTPMDAAILQRYEIVPTSALVAELQGGGDWAITQKAPIDPELDLRYAGNLTGMKMADERVTNRWTFVSTP